MKYVHICSIVLVSSLVFLSQAKPPIADGDEQWPSNSSNISNIDNKNSGYGSPCGNQNSLFNNNNLHKEGPFDGDQLYTYYLLKKVKEYKKIIKKIEKNTSNENK